MKKILFTSPNLRPGGAQRHLVNIVNSIDQNEFDTLLFLYSREGELIDELKTGIRVVSPDQPGFINKIFPLMIVSGIIRLAFLIRSERPDILYSRHWCKIPNSILGKFMGVKTVSGEGNNLSETLFKDSFKIKLFYLLRKIGIRYSDYIVANSRGLSDELGNVFNLNSGSHVIYNGIDIKTIRQKATESVEHPWFGDKYPVLISVGRLSAQKGHRELIKALAILRKKTEIRLIIIGEGKLRNELTEYSKSLGVADSVDLIGNVKNPFPYIKGSDIFVCSSNYEGLSNVILEASALGMPVVSTDHRHGANEIIEKNTNGILVPVGDPDSLADAIDRLINDKKFMKKIGKGADKNSENYSLGRLGKNYDKFFKGI